eukprot:1142553-Pelagomonas_calceolata.AAC.6
MVCLQHTAPFWKLNGLPKSSHNIGLLGAQAFRKAAVCERLLLGTSHRLAAWQAPLALHSLLFTSGGFQKV